MIDQAGLYADRLSVNIELPTDADLQQQAPEKSGAEIQQAMDGIKTRFKKLRDDAQARLAGSEVRTGRTKHSDDCRRDRYPRSSHSANGQPALPNS